MSENKNFFRASAEDFKKIPGSPVAYWVSEGVKCAFEKCGNLEDIAHPRKGLVTTDNERFLRRWFEVCAKKFISNCQSSDEAIVSNAKWFPINKGGSFRRWFGNNEWLINWKNNGEEIKNTIVALYNGGSYTKEIRSEEKYFLESITWSALSSGTFSVRYCPVGSLFGSGGYCAFPDATRMQVVLGLLNSIVAREILSLLSPTLNYEAGHIRSIPVSFSSLDVESQKNVIHCLIVISKADWDSYETSWDFTVNPLVAARAGALCSSADSVSFVSAPTGDGRSGQQSVVRDQEGVGRNGELLTAHCPLSTIYAAVREKWAKNCEEMRRLETENNRIFIEAYGLQDELTPEVPWHEITLTCNPWYRYGVKVDSGQCAVGSAASDHCTLPTDNLLEERLKGDTVKELISYAVGCMMGRYSLEKPGLILADQGATLADYERVVSGQCSVVSGECAVGGGECAMGGADHSSLTTAHFAPTAHFSPDEDGIIPILDNDWFADDIVTRFREFIKVAFGEVHFFANMAWIEEALGKNLRDYFTKDFYKDHLQRYQNRPIYWLFQSPKGAFRALVYMHRYKPDMVGGVLGYLRSLQTKVENQLGVATQIASDESKSSTERVRANKEVVKYAKMQKELDEYEKNVLYPLSTERIEIDLDDGVKVNYRKFGVALRKVAALDGKGE